MPDGACDVAVVPGNSSAKRRGINAVWTAVDPKGRKRALRGYATGRKTMGPRYPITVDTLICASPQRDASDIPNRADTLSLPLPSRLFAASVTEQDYEPRFG